MISLDDIPELVADVESGEVRWSVASWALLMLLGDHDVEDVVRRLPPPLRAKFTTELRDSFDNAVEANEILWIDNAGGEPAKKVQIVENARRWLQKQRDA